MFAHLEAWLLSYAHTLPLEIFAFVASFVEEIVAPIPSPTVMAVTGSFASVQGYTLIGLLVLSVIAALGKTLGATVVYFIADKAEDVLLGKLGTFFGVTHEDVERLGQKLGNGARDYLILSVARMLPFMPSSVLSVGCGLLKVPLRLYVISTFIGSIVRDAFYLYFGYVGIAVLGSIIERSESIASLVEIVFILTVVAALGYFYFKKRTRSTSTTT